MADPSGAAGRLPRGRHALTREQVVEDQRARMLRAMADAMVVHGFVRTSVAEIIRRAGVSRETFYEQFGSKDDCFAAAYDRAVDLVMAGLGGLPAAGDRIAWFERMLSDYLELLASEPAYARVFLVEVYAAGPIPIQRRATLQLRFVDAITSALGMDSDEDRLACEVLVAAIGAMATSRIATNDIDGLRDLREPFVDLVRRFVDG